MGIFPRSRSYILPILAFAFIAALAGWSARQSSASWHFLWLITALLVFAGSASYFVSRVCSLRMQVAGSSQKLRDTEQKLENLLGNLPGAAYRRVDDRDGTIISVSRGSLELTGYLPEELGRLRDLVHPDDMAAVFGPAAEENMEAQSFRRQFRLRTKAGEVKWVLESGVKIPAVDGAPAIVEGIVLDVTEWVAAREATAREAERLRLECDAEKASSKTKSDFLASIGHEIRTPLNSILGFSQILRAQLGDERLQQYVQAITASGKTLLRLINDFLDLSKIEAGRFELRPSAVDLRRVVREIELVFMPSVDEKQLNFVMELDGNLPKTIFIDEVRLRQILINLLRNAFKFTDKGRIAMSLRVMGSPRPGTVDLQLAVTDTGIGVSPEDQETIFDAFVQQRQQDQAKYAGTGLGLSITRRLVEILGGRISLQSEVDKGSTFIVDLPNIQVTDDYFNRSMENEGRNIRFDEEAVVLVIDAVDSDRLLIREFLRSTKLALVETISIVDGVEWCMAIRPDLILLDYTLSLVPDPSLVQRFNRVKEELNIPIVVMTSASGVGSHDFYTDYRFDGWLGKPLLFEDVMRMLARFLPHATLGQEDEYPGMELHEGYSLPAEGEVRRALAGRHQLLPVLRRDLAGNLLARWKEIQETSIINEMKAFAEDILGVAAEYRLDFLADWARVVLNRIRFFDMERLPETFQLFGCLVELIEKCSRPLPTAGAVNGVSIDFASQAPVGDAVTTEEFSRSVPFC